MINPNELRIGNWVMVDDKLLDKNASREAYFHQMQGFDIYKISEREEGEENGLRGVDITERMLLSCGFKLDEGFALAGFSNKYDLNIPVKGINNNEITYYICQQLKVKNFGTYTVDGYWAANNFKYIHQLQNLFFDLTGNELTINFFCHLTNNVVK